MDSPLDTILRQQERGDLAGARQDLARYRREHPESLRAVAMDAHLALELGQLDQAEALWREGLRRQEHNAHLQAGLARTLQLQGRLADAIRAYATCLRLTPEDQNALTSLLTLQDQSGVQDAMADAAIELMLAIYEKRARQEPEKIEHLAQFAHRLDLCRRYDEAQALYEQAITRWPDSYKLHNNLGLLHNRLGRVAQGLPYLLRAVELAPEVPELHLNLGENYNRLNRFDEAEAEFKRALALKPDFDEAALNLASLYREHNNYTQALHYAEGVRARHPERAGTYNVLAILHTALGHSEAAVQAYEQCLKRSPGSSLYFSNYLLSLNYDPRQTPASLYAAHQEFARRFEPPMAEPDFPQAAAPLPGRTLRLGLISADLRMHSVAFFLEPLFAALDAAEVQLHVFSTVSRPDNMTALLRSRAPHWHEVYGRPPEAVADLVRQHQIDVLLDLSGHTGYHALPVFMRRPAPLRVSWLGYPNTTGLQCMQYRFVDDVVEPAGEADTLSSERLVRLPEGFHCFRLPREAPDVSPLPARTNGFLTFGSFNNSSKITPQVMALWARVLVAVPGSRLLLKNSGYMHPQRAAEVLAEFAALGVATDRIELLPRTPDIAAHLALYARVDVALDTFPYHGTTTTLEAIHQGVPTLTLVGDRHAARVSVSLLRQVDLPEFIAPTEDEFVRRAIWLAENADVLGHLRGDLRTRFRDSALADYGGFARKLENALRRMWIDWCREHGAEATALDAAEQALGRREAQVASRAAARQALFAQRRGRIDEAVAHLRQAIDLDADNAFAWETLADLSYQQGDFAAARRAYDLAANLRPSKALLRANLGSCCQQTGDHQAAVEHFRAALRLESNRPGIWLNLGASLQRLHRYSEAESATRQALEMLPDFAAAWNNLGSQLKDQGRFDEAVDAFCRVLQLEEGNAEAHSNLLLCLQYVPGLSEDDLRAHHASWVDRYVADIPRIELPARAGRERLRVAYLSPDFREHPISAFVEGIVRTHDRAAVEVVLVADSHHADVQTEKLAALADHFMPVTGLDDDILAERLRAAGIDVLVELSGHTAHHRLGLLARRVAPLQLSYLGYPFPTPLPNLDGWLVDTTIAGEGPWDVPAWHIAGGAHAFTPPVDAPAVVEPPCLRRGYITLGSANQAAKLGDATLVLWAEVLKRLPQSRLLLKAKQFSDPGFCGSFVERLAHHGLPIARVELRGYQPNKADHLAFYEELDLALDPTPYNGVTTTCEALWMGVPVLTLLGDRPAARHASSLLQALGRPEWIATDPADFARRALQLTAHASRLAEIRANLRSQFSQSALGDARRLTRELERLYRQRLNAQLSTAAALP